MAGFNQDFAYCPFVSSSIP